MLRRLERWTFATADVSIATNESYRQIAITRGGMDPDRVFVVRSGVDLSRVQHVPPADELRRGKRYDAVQVATQDRIEEATGLVHRHGEHRAARPHGGSKPGLVQG